MEQTHNAFGIRYPALMADPRYAPARDKKRTVRYYAGQAGYADLTVERDLAIARLADAIAYLKPRGNVAHGSSKATYTKRSRELAQVVGQANWNEAVKVAEELAAEMLAYFAACEAVR